MKALDCAEDQIAQEMKFYFTDEITYNHVNLTTDPYQVTFRIHSKLFFLLLNLCMLYDSFEI